MSYRLEHMVVCVLNEFVGLDVSILYADWSSECVVSIGCVLLLLFHGS